MLTHAILVPPFASLEFPSLEAAVASSVLKAKGAIVHTVYISHLFADLIGTDRYSRIANVPPPRGLADYVGVGHLADTVFPDSTIACRRFSTFGEYFEHTTGNVISNGDYEGVRSIWDRYVSCVPLIPEVHAADVIFFICRHQQLGATLRLSSELRKQASSALIIAFGQQIASQSQADALLSVAPAIDGVIYAGGPSTIDIYYDHLLSLKSAPGFQSRNVTPGFQQRETARGNLVAAPDFGDFYERFVDDPMLSVIPFQGSHGCWWADRHHCTFCGLIEDNQSYVEKPSSVAFDEIAAQVSRYECSRVVAADHLLSKEHAESLLSSFARQDWDVTFFFEVKPTLSKRQLRKLLDARIYTVEVGIESFDPETLSDMQKGTTPLVNIRFLKWAQELGIRVFWTLIYSLPRETPQRISDQITVLNKLKHLQPPLHATPIRLERNSPIFKCPEAFDIIRIWPTEALLHTYPFELCHLYGLAKFFDYEQESESIVNTLVEHKLQEFISDWKANWHTESLYYSIGFDFLKICDSRSSSKTEIITLRDWRYTMFIALDEIHNLSKLIENISEEYTVARSEVSAFAEELVDRTFIHCVAGAAISVVPRINLQRQFSLKYSHSGPATNSGASG